MKNYQFLFLIVLCHFCLLVAGACTGNNKNDPTSNTTPTTTPNKKPQNPPTNHIAPLLQGTVAKNRYTNDGKEKEHIALTGKIINAAAATDKAEKVCMFYLTKYTNPITEDELKAIKISFDTKNHNYENEHTFKEKDLLKEESSNKFECVCLAKDKTIEALDSEFKGGYNNVINHKTDYLYLFIKKSSEMVSGSSIPGVWYYLDMGMITYNGTNVALINKTDTP